MPASSLLKFRLFITLHLLLSHHKPKSLRNFHRPMNEGRQRKKAASFGGSPHGKQKRVPQGLKPSSVRGLCGTTKVVP
jgi:hypothetical protein